LIGTIEFRPASSSGRESVQTSSEKDQSRLTSAATVQRNDAGSNDFLGHVFEYFLNEFASAEGKKGGQFYTPRCVVQLLVEMLAPYKGRVFDPCCGSGGMFVQSVEFVKAHANGNGNGGKAKGDISIFGQESNPITWRLPRMNLAIRSIEGNLGLEPADSFHRDLHKDLKTDYILANPPFNMSDWSGDRLREDSCWKFRVPPAGNANYAWVQHFIHHLAPTGIRPTSKRKLRKWSCSRRSCCVLSGGVDGGGKLDGKKAVFVSEGRWQFVKILFAVCRRRRGRGRSAGA
jgi:type I restriction-modification system DNA methylase subunit